MAVWPNGIIASSTGAYRGVSGVPVLTSRAVWFVSSTHTRTSNSNPGTEEEEPLATLQQAITNASAGDIILVMANHAEVDDFDLNKAGLLVIGQGSTSSRPAFHGANSSVGYAFTLSAAGAMLRNVRVWGGVNAESTPLGLVNCSITGTVVEDCELNLGTISATVDATTKVPLAINLTGTAARVTIRDNTIYNRTLDEAEGGAIDKPYMGILFGVPAVGTRIIGNTFNGGTQGFDAGAIHVPTGIAVTDLYLQGNTFSNGADVLTAGTGSIRFWGYGNTFNTGCKFQNDSNRFRYYENGLTTDEVGHTALTASGFMHSGDIYYVDSSNSNASDSAPGEGTIRNRPLATLAQAQTNATASNGDLVVIESGHTETLTSPLVLSKDGIAYLGMGSGDDRALFTLADLVAAPYTTPANLFDLSGANIWIGNIRWVSTCATSSHTEMVQLAAAGQVIDGCSSTQGLQDQYGIYTTALATEVWIRANTFTRSALPPAGTENHAIGLGHTAEGYTVVEDNSLDPTTSYFWGATSRLKGGITDVSASMGSVHILGNTLLNGSDIFMQNNRKYLIADNEYNAGASGHT